MDGSDLDDDEDVNPYLARLDQQDNKLGLMGDGTLAGLRDSSGRDIEDIPLSNEQMGLMDPPLLSAENGQEEDFQGQYGKSGKQARRRTTKNALRP